MTIQDVIEHYSKYFPSELSDVVFECDEGYEHNVHAILYAGVVKIQLRFINLDEDIKNARNITTILNKQLKEIRVDIERICATYIDQNNWTTEHPNLTFHFNEDFIEFQKVKRFFVNHPSLPKTVYCTNRLVSFSPIQNSVKLDDITKYKVETTTQIVPI